MEAGGTIPAKEEQNKLEPGLKTIVVILMILALGIANHRPNVPVSI